MWFHYRNTWTSDNIMSLHSINKVFWRKTLWVEQQLLILLGQIYSLSILSGVRVALTLVSCVFFVYHCFSFRTFLLSIVLSVLPRFTTWYLQSVHKCTVWNTELLVLKLLYFIFEMFFLTSVLFWNDVWSSTSIIP
jgi:hypothetical protein